ncbi:MAG: transporter [Planctomycetota bacterium]|nr:transporter [Planctomycetota bacterium]
MSDLFDKDLDSAASPAARRESGRSHDPYAALRHRDFRLFLANSVAATIGGEMQSVAVGWELYERTSSKLALAFVGLVQALPVLLLALPAGLVADRFSRKKVVLATAAAITCGSIGLAAVSWLHAPVAWFYVFLAIIGIAGAFSFPARWAFMPELVPGEDFHNAVTWRSSAWQVAAMVGPGLGGLGIALFKTATPVYLADAACGVVVCAMIASIRSRPAVNKKSDPMTWDTFAAGFRFVWSSPLVLAAITLDMFAVLLGGATALLPVFAKDILHIGPTGLGLLRAAPSLGALSTALYMAHRPPLQRAGRDLLLAVTGFGVATIVFGLSRDPILSFAMLVLTGVFDNISVVIRSTLIQLRTPDAMRGRVASVNSIFIGMSNEVGSFESGSAAWLIGTVPAVVLGGIGCIVVVILTAIKWPEIVRLGPLDKLGEETDRVVIPDIPCTPLEIEGHR